MISIHAPRMGSDGHAVPCAFQSPEISIHAPRMGSDPAPSRPAPTPRYFNPRSPDGERRIPACRPCRARYFNPRSPDGERPGSVSRLMQSKWNSNPRSPDGEQREAGVQAAVLPFISIHAPRMGSDSRPHAAPCTPRNFNPRSPDGERHTHQTQATKHRHFNPRSPDGERLIRTCLAGFTSDISIHAPRMGSDAFEHIPAGSAAKFQSTLPGWGATRTSGPSAGR